VFGELAHALADCREKREAAVFIIGGAEIYRQALPTADVLHLTRVQQAPAGDVSFPTVDFSAWTQVAREEHPGYCFIDYHRR